MNVHSDNTQDEEFPATCLWEIQEKEMLEEIARLEKRIDEITAQRDKWADKYLNILLQRKSNRLSFNT